MTVSIKVHIVAIFYFQPPLVPGLHNFLSKSYGGRNLNVCTIFILYNQITYELFNCVKNYPRVIAINDFSVLK